MFSWSYLSLSSFHLSGMHFTRFDADSQTTSNGCTPSSASGTALGPGRCFFLWKWDVLVFGSQRGGGPPREKEAKVGLRSRDGPGRFSAAFTYIWLGDRSTQGLWTRVALYNTSGQRSTDEYLSLHCPLNVEQADVPSNSCRQVDANDWKV